MKDMLHQQCVLQKTDTYGHFAVRSGRDGEHCLQRPGGEERKGEHRDTENTADDGRVTTAC